MGGLFSGKTKTTSTEKTDTGPSAFQAPYITQSFDEAQKLYNSTKDSEAYQGQTYSGMTPEAKAALESMKSYAGGTALSQANQISAVGSQLVTDSSGKAMSNLDRFTAMAGEDPLTANIAAAQQYAANPYVDGMIDANSRDINRNLYEKEIPGIDRAASGSGNLNSSRAGVASGIAQRGAADRIGDISAQIRGSAYETGLTRAAADRATTLDAYGKAADGYSAMTANGISAIGAGQSAAYNAFAQINQASLLSQADTQGQLDADKLKWQEEDQRQAEMLARYNSVVGSNQWGASGLSSGTGTSKNSGNIMGQIAGTAATAASFAGKG